ncbi:protein SON isoform X2 [Octopus sinensis]|uniref:Protein SON isoform X2 n=1 Tax=Octopus sinensis TaxID=2607531 RepID=A0A6P7T677_9MOLL|nr:protein SON isoform X2 [Octopus sinensis]
MISFDKTPVSSETCHSVMQSYPNQSSNIPETAMYSPSFALPNDMGSRLQYTKPAATLPNNSIQEQAPYLYSSFQQQTTIQYPTTNNSLVDNSNLAVLHQPTRSELPVSNNNLINVYSNSVSQSFYNQTLQSEESVNLMRARPSDGLLKESPPKDRIYEHISHAHSISKSHKKITELSDEDLSSRFPSSPLISSKIKPSSLTLYSSICKSLSSSSSSSVENKKRRRSRSRSSSPSYSRSKSPSSYSRSRSSSRRKSSRRSRSKSPYSKGRGHSDKPRYSSRLNENDKSSKRSSRSRSREKDYHRETSQGDKYRASSRHRSYNTDSNHSSTTDKSITSKDDRLAIDKVKLHNIAVEKLIKSGTAAKEDIASLRAGGKTVEELINYCKQISQKEHESSSDNSLYDSKKPEEEIEITNHPFKRPENNCIVQAVRSAILNMKNNKHHQLPSPQDMVKDSPLRLQFPVSSGSQHRAKELQSTTGQLGFQKNSTAHSVYAPGRNGKLDSLDTNSNSDQVFPEDCQQLNRWAQSKQLPGLFTGSTGAKVMTLEELNGPDKKLQAWAKKQQIINAAPVKGGIGMHLLQKMGWREGEGLGKNSKGPTEPIIVNVKIDRKGLTSHGEDPKKSQAVELAKHISGKHPVSALVELSNKLKWGAPIFQQIEERGPDHKKTFKYKVSVNNITYQPTTSSNSKKTGRAKAAIVCLHNLGLLPKEFSV